MLTRKQLQACTEAGLNFITAELREVIGIRESAIRAGTPMGNPERFAEYQDELCMVANERRRRLSRPGCCPLCGQAKVGESC
jgi:hypothetical protein